MSQDRIDTISSNLSVTERTTVIRDNQTKTEAHIVTRMDDKRVVAISVYVIVGKEDENTYTDAKKRAVHTAIVNALTPVMGDGI